MSNEEFEEKVDFVVEQQAQLAARFGQLVDIVSRFAQGTLDRFEATNKRVDNVDERISALVNSQMQTEENVKRTSENLRNLVAAVNRYFEGRNGKIESQG